MLIPYNCKAHTKVSMFLDIISECISDEDCNEANKTMCVSNKCQCDVGFFPINDKCTKCLPNQILVNDTCQDCSAGLVPASDRLSCMNCPDDRITKNGIICIMCSNPEYVPNANQTDCVGMFNYFKEMICYLSRD